MPSRLPSRGLILDHFVAVRPVTLPNGNTYAAGNTIDPAFVLGVKHLDSLMPKFLRPVYLGDPTTNFSKVWNAEYAGAKTSVGFQQHNVHRGELATAIVNF